MMDLPKTITLRNGDKAESTFSTQEMRGRIERLREVMAENEIDVALALNEIYRAHDLLRYRPFGYGHSLGVLCHYDGRGVGLELRENVETVLQPGATSRSSPTDPRTISWHHAPRTSESAMKNVLGVAALFGFVVLLWYGLSQWDALPRGLRFPAGEYGALLDGRGG